MSSLRRALRHGSLYTLFQGLGMAVSLVSFPLLTRLLTVEEYGYLALFNATVAMLLAVSKCGITTSFVRMHADVLAHTVESQRRLYSSALGASLFLALILVTPYSLSLFLLIDYFGTGLTHLLWLSAALVLVQNARDVFMTYFRAEEKVVALSAITLLIRVGAVGIGYWTAVTLLRGLGGYLAGSFAFEMVVVSFVAAFFVRRRLLSPNCLSAPTMKQLLLYGAPLLLFELSSLVNDYADRFLINHFLGASSVGIYSVGYNLALYVQGLITAPIWMAIFPIYTKMWEADGPEKTATFLATILRYYVRGAILVAVVVSLVSHELITLLATAKFNAASLITPYVIVGILIYGTTHITAAGFYLVKRTKTIAMLTVGAAALNVLLNLVLIPAWGILGAAYATTASYLALTVLVTYKARTLLAIKWPMGPTIICLGAAFVAFFAASPITYAYPVVSLILKSFVATTVYVLLVLLFDRSLRKIASEYGEALLRRNRSH